MRGCLAVSDDWTNEFLLAMAGRESRLPASLDPRAPAVMDLGDGMAEVAVVGHGPTGPAEVRTIVDIQTAKRLRLRVRAASPTTTNLELVDGETVYAVTRIAGR